MIRIRYSNQTEALVAALVEQLDQPRDPLVPIDIVVPNRNLERYLDLQIASALGISANIRYHRLERFIARFIRGGTTDLALLTREHLESLTLSAFLDDDWLAQRDVAPVKRYLFADEDEEGVDTRRVELAIRMATLLEEYTYSRPELLATWSAGRELGLSRDETWQRALYQRVLATRGRSRDGRRLLTLPEALRELRERPLAPQPDTPLHIFGISYVARVFLWSFSMMGQNRELGLYVLNPCEEYWEDVPTEQRVLRALAPEEEALDPNDTPALVLWGRPGREHVHLLGELAQDFDALFVSPPGETLLRKLQRDVLARQPAETKTPIASGEVCESITLLPAPGIRRELEAIADEIWRIVEQGDVRFNEIALFINGPERDVYLPHVEAVFREARDIPFNVVDLSLAGETGLGSRVVEAASMLIDLPLSGFTRPEVLALVTHPCVRSRVRDLPAEEWERAVDRVGAFHGIDHADHEGTYITSDLINWDQGIRRVALGAFMSGALSGDSRFFALDGERYQVDEARDDEATATLALLLRALANDVRAALAQRASLTAWSAFFAAQFNAFLVANGSREESALRRCITAARSLADRDLRGDEVGFRVAHQLLRTELSRLRGGRGEYLADGVVVSSFLPMRAIPFRVAFVAGLGEARFPAPERRDALDLRAKKRERGDVSPSERDKYMFLEAILSVRDRVVLSWVSRDPLTGDEIVPSVVVRQLTSMIERGYKERPLRRKVPLRRHEERGTSLREAKSEARARELGERLRGDYEVELSLTDEIIAEPRLRAALGVVDITDAQAQAPERAVVSISALRRFLESPLQGWASAVLGIRSEDEFLAEQLGAKNEPLAVRVLDGVLTLRQAYLDEARHEVPAQATYGEQTHRKMSEGRWPVGTLAEQRAREDAQVIAGWRRLVDASFRHITPRVARFGGGGGTGDAEDVYEGVELATATPVSIVGRSQPLLVNDADVTTRASLLLMAKAPPGGIHQETERMRVALRAFLDHLMLTITSGEATHRAFVVYGGNPATDASLTFQPVSRARASAYLTALVDDLHAGPHDTFSPCEAVLRRPHQFRSLTPRALLDETERVRRNHFGGSARFGPVRDAASVRAPAEDVILRQAKARFGLFFELLGYA